MTRSPRLGTYDYHGLLGTTWEYDYHNDYGATMGYVGLLGLGVLGLL